MAKEATSIKLEKELMDKIKELSIRENRTLSNYIETILIRHLEEIDKQKKPAN